MTDILLELIEEVAALLPGFAPAHAIPEKAPNFPNDLEPVIRAEPSEPGAQDKLVRPRR
jgi:hypothetical protein